MKHPTTKYDQPEFQFDTIGQNPSGLCVCGCGGLAPIAQATDRKRGYVRGQPRSYIQGHYRKGAPGRPTAERFWERIEKTETCWLWTGAKTTAGYGTLSVNGKTTFVHRISYELHYGPIPDGLDILHKCDNPPCCRPDHLLAGSHLENMQDRERKGRGNQAQGEAASKAKLAEKEVKVIRKLHAEGQTFASLAERFGVSAQSISDIVKRKHWRHIE